MRTAPLATFAALAIGLIVLPACNPFQFEGKPAPGAFPQSAFVAGDQSRSTLESVQSACESYCVGAVDCDAAEDSDTCIADCVEPKLTAMEAQPEVEADPTVDCTSDYMASMSCAIEPVCEAFGACDEALDTYVSCASTLAP